MAKRLRNALFPKVNEELPLIQMKDEQNEKFFEGSENASKIEDSKYIENIYDKNNKIIGRKFVDRNNEIKYFELFENDKMKVLGISSNITFIHSYSKYKDNFYNPNEFIGFRYYNNGVNSIESKFFTLIKKNNLKYFILEKNNYIKDINNLEFYDENLDCFEIINKIIFEKYRDKIIGENGEIFPEIIGYSYALASKNKINKFRFVEPLIANLNMKNSISDSIPEIIENNNVYLEPFLYDGHISLIISSCVKNERFNIILDMSHHHFSNEEQKLVFLPKTLKTDNNIIYPKYQIQLYSSCCLWLYGEIEYLMDLTYIDNPFKFIFETLDNNDVEFYVKIVNKLSKKLQNINELIKKEFNIYKKDSDANKIDFDRIIIPHGKIYFSIHKDIVFNKFLDIDKFFNDIGFFLYVEDATILSDCQRIIMDIYEFKNKILFNEKYYDLISNDEEDEKYKKILLEYMNKINILIAYFENQYNYAIYYKNMLCYPVMISHLLDKIRIPITLDDKIKKKILNFNYNNFLQTFSRYLNKYREIENIMKIYGNETIENEIKCSDEIYFSAMNK